MKIIVTLVLTLFISACISVPDIYLIDRHTVMESEASGEWPELEKRFLENSIAKGPTDLAKEPQENRQKKAFRVLNGEMPSEEKVQISEK